MATGTILLIDDEEALRAVIRETLENAGYRVIPAANGRDAVAVAKGRTFDLVITDLIMPYMDGIEVLSQLRKSHADTPVVAMSGGGRMPPGQYLEMARSYGAKAILEKPFSSEQLLMTVGLLIPGRNG